MDTDMSCNISALANYEQFKTEALEAIILMFRSFQTELNHADRQHVLDHLDTLSEEYGLTKTLRIPTEKFKIEDEDGSEVTEYVKYTDAFDILHKVIEKLTMAVMQLVAVDLKKRLDKQGEK